MSRHPTVGQQLAGASPIWIDGRGGHPYRESLKQLMRRSGAEDRQAKAQARRERRANKRIKHIDTEET